MFGKFGVGGALPAKWSGGQDESALDLSQVNVGTIRNTPDTAPEKTVPELAHK